MVPLYLQFPCLARLRIILPFTAYHACLTIDVPIATHCIHTALRCTGGGEGNGADEWVNMDLEREGDGEEESDDDEQMGFVHKQPLVATGMAATLALLKGSGERE